MSQENTPANESAEPEKISPIPENSANAANAANAEDPASQDEVGKETDADVEQAVVDALPDVEALQADVEKYKDQFLRANAEMENIRRRSQNEIINTRKFAIEGFVRELLQVQDSLQLASQVTLSENNSDAVKQMLEGLQLTCKQLDAVFEKFDIQMISPAKGDKLDPKEHQTMSMQPSDEVAPNHVLAVVQKGYLLKGRLLRPAMVLVATAPVS
ncbi:MAG: nucleotide exchange factor GrpE [Arenicellales bacterium WSBS_2016_MAG_OTU3]